MKLRALRLLTFPLMSLVIMNKSFFAVITVFTEQCASNDPKKGANDNQNGNDNPRDDDDTCDWSCRSLDPEAERVLIEADGALHSMRVFLMLLSFLALEFKASGSTGSSSAGVQEVFERSSRSTAKLVERSLHSTRGFRL